jgi:hypothetical protein
LVVLLILHDSSILVGKSASCVVLVGVCNLLIKYDENVVNPQSNGKMSHFSRGVEENNVFVWNNLSWLGKNA